jgi:protein TonB
MKPITFIAQLFFAVTASAQNDTAAHEPAPFICFFNQPEFPGGDQALLSFIKENVTYPKFEKDSSIQGRVIIQFYVNDDGTIGGIHVIKGVSKGLDEEALRVVKLLPRFKPWENMNKTEKPWLNLPINFKL